LPRSGQEILKNRRERQLMRLTFDTKVAVSGLLWNGTPARLLDAAHIQEIRLFTRAHLLAELAGILICSPLLTIFPRIRAFYCRIDSRLAACRTYVP
jgi:hypothetical protein